MDDVRAQWAVEMGLIRIGEAVAKIPAPVRECFDGQPWRQIIDMRNLAAHPGLSGAIYLPPPGQLVRGGRARRPGRTENTYEASIGCAASIRSSSAEDGESSGPKSKMG
ncbi:DUF86 domain-containing protein [Microbacterium sp. SORGH_AS_0344]|uniref:HepT-like ribonuclease domain-containing protein n=1 Tax=Microbacterium sp. SORGH_AS_0344 TaxID=3041767 RepID=UPI00358F6FAD